MELADADVLIPELVSDPDETSIVHLRSCVDAFNLATDHEACVTLRLRLAHAANPTWVFNFDIRKQLRSILTSRLLRLARTTVLSEVRELCRVDCLPSICSISIRGLFLVHPKAHNARKMKSET